MDRHPNQHALAGPHGPEDLTAEILIGRIVDGETLPVDRARFDELAAANPRLWQLLALRQQDAAALARRFESQTAGIDHVDLPVTAGATRRGIRAPWWLAISGWAAMIVVTVFWGMQHSGDVRKIDMLRAATGNDPSRAMTPDEHLRRYKSAPFVVGEWSPTLLQSEKLPDGRTFIRMLRRIEETAYLNADQPLPAGADGRLTLPPDEVRKHDPSLAKPATPPN